jgi:uncharacterized protein (TIGR02285 family)
MFLIKTSLTLTTFLVVSLYPVSVSAEKRINWATIDWPPFMIVAGDDARQGLIDHVITMYQKNMPNYQHINQVTNFSRTWRDIKKGKHLCNPVSIKTGVRPDFARYSLPLAIAPSNRIIMKRSTYQKMATDQPVQLAQLIRNHRWRSVFDQGRSYTPALDTLIQQRPDDSKLHADTVSSLKLVELLTNDRFDYLIEYPIVAAYYSNSRSISSDKLVNVSIAEIAPYTAYYLACPNNDWGKSIISDFNVMLTKIHNTPQYLKLLTNAGTNIDQKEHILTNYLKLFNKESALL